MLIGIDMGGTNIDGVIIEDSRIIKSQKNPVDRKDIFNTIKNMIEELIYDIDRDKISRINLSTTISTNSIVENKISEVGLVLESGPGINNDFSYLTDNIIYISGYNDHRGKIVKDINKKEILDIVDKFNDIENIGIVSKFSTRNPSHENEIYQMLKDDFNQITLGNKISGKLNFPRRVNTSYFNSAVYNICNEFANNIERVLREKNIKCEIYILKADGGTMKLNESMEKPVETILSGPAASYMGINALTDDKEDSILLDIGGTTTDIFFTVNGVPVFEPQGIEIEGYKTLVRSIYSESIGIGGDSVIEIVEGEIIIGPERKDKSMAFGGKYPTPTDAMIVLGELEIGNRENSIRGISKLSNELNLTIEELSIKILEKMAVEIYNNVNKLLEKINAKPLYTVKEVLENRQIKPKVLKIIGGPAKILSKYLSQIFNLEILYPENYQIANAIGAALAIPTMEINLLADTDRRIVSIPEVDLYKKIDRNFNLDDGRKMVLDILNSKIIDKNIKNMDAEIIEENSFNMYDGYTRGKNIRIKGQIKPGLVYKIGGGDSESKK